jgi:ribosomal-protein-alanine N-acetyltransferase
MMQIVLMEASHVPAVAELEKQCFSMPWSEASVRSELDNPLSLWLVAVADGTVAGYIGSQAVLDEADVMNVAVSDLFRRQGIAQALVEELVRRLCGKGVRCLTLEVRASNTPAKSLYEKLGFAQVGRRPNYYRNPKEDALILRKEWAL